jgi:hypothetical protein
VNEKEVNEILTKLRTNENGTTVTFTKKDGTKREMLCTLIESKIPADKRPKASVGLEEETNSSTVGSAVRVFDLGKSEWRSFRWDTVISVN